MMETADLRISNLPGAWRLEALHLVVPAPPKTANHFAFEEQNETEGCS